MGTKACSARSTEHGRRVVRTCQVYVTLRKIQFVAVPTGNFNLLRLQQWLLCCFHARLCWSFILGMPLLIFAFHAFHQRKTQAISVAHLLQLIKIGWYSVFFLVCSLFSHYCGTLKGMQVHFYLICFAPPGESKWSKPATGPPCTTCSLPDSGSAKWVPDL